ncbi:MAG: hypothetical protein AAF750_03750 [Planctomycetota bacterium]
MQRLEAFLVQHLEADDFLSPTHRFDEELVLAYLRLHTGQEVDWPNRLLADFELDPEPRDWGDGEPDTADWDFTGVKLLRLYLDFKNDPALKAAARERVETLLRNFPQPRVRHNRNNDCHAVWPGIHTENHDLILLTIGYFRAYLNREDVTDHEAHLARSLGWRMRFGWLEANSPTYQTRYVEPLAILIDHAPNASIRVGATALLNHLLAERAMFSVQGYLAGPQARTRQRPTEPWKDRMTALLYLWFGEPVPQRHEVSPYREAYWLLRSGFKPDASVATLWAERQEVNTEPRVYRGMRTRRGGEYTEFRYYVSPHVALGSCGWRGLTSRFRYHNTLLAHPRGYPVAVWHDYRPEDVEADPRYGVGEVVQWGEALVTRGKLKFTDSATDEMIDGWRVIHTPWAAAAQYSLPEGWHLLVVIDLRRGGTTIQEALGALVKPQWDDQQAVSWINRKGDILRFDLNLATNQHGVYVNGERVVTPHGKLHDCHELLSWYGTGIVNVRPQTAPECQLTAESLDHVLLRKDTQAARQAAAR